MKSIKDQLTDVCNQQIQGLKEIRQIMKLQKAGKITPKEVKEFITADSKEYAESRKVFRAIEKKMKENIKAEKERGGEKVNGDSL